MRLVSSSLPALARPLLSGGLLGLTLMAPLRPAHADKEVAVSPAMITPGQAITLRWYFTGTKVVVSGGRFGKGTIVTGQSSLTDKPLKTTRYTFDVYYIGAKVNAMTGKTEQKPLHATYTAIAEVQPPVPGLTYYQNPYGWQVGYLTGWKRDNVPMPDPAHNALMYFQKEDDSVDRLAVSILPANEMTSADLMQKVQKSLPSSYNDVQVLSDQELTYAGVPAVLSVFTGLDQTHPGTRTQSIILALVKDGNAYVVSGRTAANRYKLQQPALEKMVRSLGFTRSASTK